MICSKKIPDKDGYYWVKMSPAWEDQVVEYSKGVVYITGSRERYSPYEDVYEWFERIDRRGK